MFYLLNIQRQRGKFRNRLGGTMTFDMSDSKSYIGNYKSGTDSWPPPPVGIFKNISFMKATFFSKLSNV